MIYTSYFARLRSMPETVIPVSICKKEPNWYSGAQYKKLAPTFECLNNYKQSNNKEEFVERYKREILDRQNVNQVILELYASALGEDAVHGKSIEELMNVYDIALLCYEKPADFCHRKLVSAWLGLNGIGCAEWSAEYADR